MHTSTSSSLNPSRQRIGLLLATCTAAFSLSGCGGSSGTAASGGFSGTNAQAATLTAQSGTNACAAIQPFYWEIGDKTQKLAGSSIAKAGSSTSYDANSLLSIASASKWIYGAYVAERRGGVLTVEDIQYLHFQSGYTGFAAIGCQYADTVDSCLARGSNGVQDSTAIGKFYYNGGHMEKHASLSTGMALGGFNSAAFAAEMQRALGSDIALAYSQPQPAGGVVTTPASYAVFLRKLLNNQLQMGALLGTNKVCTNVAQCGGASLYTPVPSSLAWHYSMGHWVEDDPVSGDGSFSSAGAFGFYPWIDASKSYYGIVARSDSAGSGFDSAMCGALIRKAWVTGVAQ